MGKYSDIAMALSFCRGVGKTLAAIKFAPDNSTVMCCDTSQMRILREQALCADRGDLNFIVVDYNNLRGTKGPFVVDHFSVSHWLNEAQGEIDRLKKRVSELEKGEWLKDGK